MRGSAAIIPPEAAATSDCPPDAAFADLLEGQLAEPDVARLTRHAAQCSACSTMLDELTRGSTAGGELGTDAKIARELLRDDATSAAASSVGRTLDRKYALLRLLGKGGMGEVYEAEHLRTGRRVAVKLIRARLLERGEEAESRFRREARAAGATHSPHIVDVLDAGEDAATSDLYLVMEYLRGEDLQHLIDRVGPLSPDVALRIAAQALVGLAKAHDAGIVHRDIKPANLFLARSEEGEVTVKLLDFGIVKVTADALHVALTSGLTRTAGPLGSPLYMSPEQMQNSTTVDGRTDLWSLGSALYCALAGRAPFGHVENLFELLPAIRAGGAPPLRELAPWVSPEMVEAVHRALAVDPERRYPSAVAMLEAIRALLPGGLALREEMLAGISPEAGVAVAVSRPPLARERHVVDPGGGAKVSGDAATVALDTSAGGAQMAERREGGLRPPSTRVRIAVLAGLMLGAGAAVRYATLPAPASSASPPPESATAQALRRVRLQILPDDASVEVDGARADVWEGAVEVAGVLGSVHRVRVSRGGAELFAEVFVTDSGAVPAKLELAARKPGAEPPEAGATHAGMAGSGGVAPSAAIAGPGSHKPQVASASAAPSHASAPPRAVSAQPGGGFF